MSFLIVFHLGGIKTLPFVFHVLIEIGLANEDMVPETFHVVDSDFDGLNILDSFVNKVWLSEFISVESEIFDLFLENGELIEDTVKLLLSEFGSAFVLEKFSLLHLLVEASDLFFELFDVALVSIILLLN